MKQRRGQIAAVQLPSQLVWSPVDDGDAVLYEVRDTLNSDSNDNRRRDRLRGLVDAWMRSGQDLEKMIATAQETNPEFLGPILAGWRVVGEASAAPRARLTFISEFSDTAKVMGLGSDQEPTPEAKAKMLFDLLIITPGCEKLAGPCPRCGRYYIKRRPNNTTYCTRRCANAATAKERAKNLREEVREAKRRRAQAAINRWTPSKGDWKRWVSLETGVKMKFLTQQIKAGNLREPQPKGGK